MSEENEDDLCEQLCNLAKANDEKPKRPFPGLIEDNEGQETGTG